MKYKDFYSHLMVENQLTTQTIEKDNRITTRFRHVTDPDEIDNIQQNYERYAKRANINPTDLEYYISSGYGIVYSPYGSESATVGQFIGSTYAVSHYAPESDKDGVTMLLDLLHTSTPVVFAVPERLSTQLKRIGFEQVATGVPMCFKGEVMEKNIMTNKSMTKNDVVELLTHWMEEAKSNHLLSEHPRVKEFFTRLQNFDKLK